ncbi:ATP-dependent RNA helicase [Parafrankia colletiae]|uniref:ATP-dependent RNA helicase DeaD n=1 Tax=Parafrankia colletiae TaxID=573497 RepID=A0A1S1Q5B4_9ACTN|nr:DEAD/DEAH box helicase [Parafrankia colletiae]MCK9899976.1 DEAD/DEAH box helicase [Frankia sp. Cpl3]OHV28671.1 ATP-dependent RNA helicase [Parafrankia colletiae]
MTESEDQQTFQDLGLGTAVLRALTELGYEVPSPIQIGTIPALLAGRDVVGLAQTGTGKTAAFALPILSRIDVRSTSTQALVLAPTRELVLQVAEAFGRYAHHLTGLHVLPVYGGQAYAPQLAGIRRGAQVIVGTPGRVIDHLERGTLSLGGLRMLVLDEADEMLRMGFQEEVDRILAATPDAKQVALFSATMPAPIRRISRQYLRDPVEITVRARTVTAANTRQRFLTVAGPRKMDALTRVLEVEPFEAMIIFVRTKSATEDVAERLRSRGFATEAINGDLSQPQREKLIAQLRDGTLDLLVATDVAARGLDVERVTHVVNYDIPTDPESYVHRIGRTGRAGRSGEALLLVTPREKGLLAAIERATRQPLAEMELPTAEDVNAQRVAKFHDAITAALDAPAHAVFRDLVLGYTHEHDVPLADIAAALAVMTRHEQQEFLLPLDIAPPARDRPARDRPARGAGGPRPVYATYRIGVGHRQRVTPGQIVGALANEGGLDRADFGRIDIRADYSLVELPTDLPKDTQQALTRTRIAGQPLNLRAERPSRESGARLGVSRRGKSAPSARRTRRPV